MRVIAGKTPIYYYTEKMDMMLQLDSQTKKIAIHLQDIRKF